MSHLDIVLNHIGQHNPLYPSNKHEVQHYVLQRFFPMVLINFGHLGVVCFLLFQLSLLLVQQHRCVAHTLNVIGLGAVSII